MSSKSMESHGAYPALPSRVEAVAVKEVLDPVAVSEKVHGDSREIVGAIPEDYGVIANIQLGNEPGNELKIIDISALEPVDSDGENILVSVLGVDQVISKDVKFLAVGVGKEKDEAGLPKLAQLELKEGSTEIGSVSSDMFQLGDNVSREHATLQVSAEGTLSLIDHSTNGSKIEFLQDGEVARDEKSKKDGAAVLKASGTMPPLPPHTAVGVSTGEPSRSAALTVEPMPTRDIDALQSKTTNGRLNVRLEQRQKAKDLRELRAQQEEVLRPILEAKKTDLKRELKEAKRARRTTRWENGRLGLLAERSALRGELRQKAKDSGASFLRRASMYKQSFSVARKQVAREAAVKLGNAEVAVTNARRSYYGVKNELGAMNFISRHGGRNTLRENKRIIRGGGAAFDGLLSEDAPAETVDQRNKRIQLELQRMRRGAKTATPQRRSRNAVRAKNLRAEAVK